MNITASNGVMNLGHQLDNLATVISFPIGDVIADQGAGGSWSVRIQRNGDVAAYPTSNFSISNNNLNLIMTSSDLANVGEGQIQLKYAVGSKVLMSRVYKFYSHYSLDGSGTVPAPWQSWVDAVEADADRAEAAVAHYPYIDSTTKHWMQYNATTEQFVDTGIVAEGQDGEDGADGEDGVSPVATVSKVGKIATITITDATGTTTATVSDGNDGATGPAGQDGQDGEDGFSPSATVSKTGSVATITITDKNGTTTAQVNDGITQDLSAYRTSAAQDAIDATLQPKTDNLLSTVSKNVVGAINENKESIDNLKAIGRFLAVWNCTTGLPTTNPSTSPYTYKTGDYFLVGTVGTTNYKPNGSTYTIGVASTTVETNEVTVSDYYVYDGTDWILLKNTQKALTFANITGQPSDNSALNTALSSKVGFTNYPTSGTGGVIKANPTAYGFGVDSSGGLIAANYSYNDYTSKVGTFNVGKGTLENVLDNESLRIDKTQTLSSAQKSQAESNIGIASETFSFTLSDGTVVNKVMKVGG